MTPSALAAIISGKEDPFDEKLADRAVYHYRIWLKENLYNALDWNGKIYYNTAFRWDKVVSELTMFGFTGGGMYKIAREILAKSAVSNNKITSEFGTSTDCISKFFLLWSA